MATADERLATLEEKQRSQDANCRIISGGIQAELQAMNKHLDRIEHAVQGNGSPGLAVRVDRLEHGRKAWLLIATPTAIAIIGVCLRAMIWGF